MGQLNYPISTTALSLTASGTTIGSGNTQSATFVVGRTMVRTGIGAGELLSGSRTWSIHYVISAMATPYEMRLKLQRRNSSQVVQSESSYGTTISSTGTYDDNITWDSGTWNANDELTLVWEHRRPSGTGNKNGTMNANGASYVDAPNEITGSVTESATAADAPTVEKTTLSAVTETGSATETQTPALTTLASITETVSATETQSASFLFTATVTETGTAADSEDANKVLAASITETGAADESQSVLLSTNSAVTESASSGETQSSVLITLAGVTESTTTDSDQSAVLITISAITESGAATDLTDATVTPGGGGVTYNVSITESATAVDVVDSVIASKGGGGAGPKRRRSFQRNERAEPMVVPNDDEEVMKILERFVAEIL